MIYIDHFLVFQEVKNMKESKNDKINFDSSENQIKPDLEKWVFKMKYCQKHKIPPAQSWAWELAEKEYQEVKTKTIGG